MNETPSLEMDALTAHLDRGWDLLHHGDSVAARVSAQHILRIDAASPEGHLLLGAIAAAEGEPEEAVDFFRQATDLDPDYLDAYLYAAEVAIHPLGDFEHALELCDEAEALVRDAPEELDVIVLRTEALVAAGRLDEARREAARIPAGPAPTAVYALRAGRVLLDVGEVARGKQLLEQAAGEEDLAADAHYYLGLGLEQERRPREALEHFLCTHDLDARAPAPPGSSSNEELAGIVREVLDALAPPLGEELRRAPVRILDLPALELVAEGADPRCLVHLSVVTEHSGPPVPGPDREPSASGPQIAQIFVYQRNVERVARSGSEASAELQTAFEQETALLCDSEPAAKPGTED